MRCSSAQRWVVLYLVTGCALGCQNPPGYRDDPLMLGKKHTLGKILEAPPPLLLAQAEPATPLLPAVTYAQLAPLPRSFAPLQLAGSPESFASPSAGIEPRIAVPFTTVARPKIQNVLSPSPAVRRRASTTCAEASDLSWLQGVLLRDSMGSWSLRYRVGPDRAALPILLELPDPAALETLRTGDVVLVEGEPVRTEPGAPPRYRVRAVQMVERPQ